MVLIKFELKMKVSKKEKAHCILHQYDKVAVSRGLFLQLFISRSKHT